MNKKIKYTSKNGYTGVMYGNSSLVILDENGKEVFHTGSRTCNTYEELVEQTDTYPEFRAMLEEHFKKEGIKNEQIRY